MGRDRFDRDFGVTLLARNTLISHRDGNVVDACSGREIGLAAPRLAVSKKSAQDNLLTIELG